MKKTAKRAISAILICAAAAAFTMFGFAGNLTGDVNSDGAVNSEDALSILKYSAGMEVNDINPAEADINNDGRINSVDALTVLRISVGLIKPETTEQEIKAPGTKEEIVEYYNNAVSRILTSRAGFTKSRETTVKSMDFGNLSPKYVSLIKGYISDFLGEGEQITKNPSGTEGKLRVSALKASEVTEAVCAVDKNGNLTITIRLNDGESFAADKMSKDTSPVAHCGIYTQQVLTKDADYINSKNLYDQLMTISGLKVGRVSETTKNASITAVIDGETGNMVSADISFDWDLVMQNVKYSFLVKVDKGTGSANTRVILKDFKW